jgi:hypothetical protein
MVVVSRSPSRLGKAEALKDVADSPPNRSKWRKMKRIKPVIGAPPIVCCRDQVSFRPKHPGYFAE